MDAEEEGGEEVAGGGEELVEKGTVALTETSTHWLLTVAGTCVDLGRGGSGAGVGRAGAGTILDSASLDLEDRWTQTLDLPRKKKGTQCDPIVSFHCRNSFYIFILKIISEYGTRRSAGVQH